MFSRTSITAASLLLIASGLAHAQASGKRVTVNGMRMYYEVSGTGDANGKYLRRKTWQQVAELLST